jgi:ATP-dependent Lhr-like helicase
VLRATRMPGIFGRLGYVVIDEMHAFVGAVRGAQLQSQLHRLQLRCGCNPVRVGLSATLAEPERAQAWLRPGGAAATLIAPEMGSSELAMRVRGLWRSAKEEPDESEGEDVACIELARAILVSCHGATNLVFANAKSYIEQIADALTDEAKRLGVNDEVVVHHGSLSRERREYAEQRLRSDRPCTAVCSNTLELGIDIGEIDCVVQVDAPWSVASLVQRLGRSGRRPGQARKLRGFLVEDRPAAHDDVWQQLRPGFMQAIAIIELMLEKFLEPPRTDRSHRSTLVHQLLSTLAETGGIQAAALYRRLLGAGAFAPMGQGEFALLLRELGRRDLLEQLADGSLVLGLKGQKLVDHYSFYAAFQGASEYRVVYGSDEIGMLPEQAIPPIDEHVILAGRRWQVRDIDNERRQISVVPSKGRRPPWFGAGPLDVHPAVHARMRELLCGDVVPTYLDDVAQEMLADARKAAQGCNRFRPPVQVGLGDTIRLFLFSGSRVLETIRLVLARAGLKPRAERIGLEVAGSATEVLDLLTAFARSDDDGSALTEYAEETEGARLRGDKFDEYLPTTVWRSAFVNDRLDLQRTKGSKSSQGFTWGAPRSRKWTISCLERRY